MKPLFELFCESFDLEASEDGRAFLSLVRPLLSLPDVEALHGFCHHMSVSRLQHVRAVAYISYHICREKGLRVTETCYAALLHDLFFFDHKKGERIPHAWRRHPAIAWENAKRLCAFSEVGEDIICRHMWPLTRGVPKTKEGKIVSWVDKYCAMQEFFLSCKQKMFYIRRKDTQP